MKTHYFLTDLKRVTKGKMTYFSIAGVAISLFYSLETLGLQENVLNTYWRAISLSGLTIAYACCILPYSFVFCEDLEHNFARCQIVRGSLRKYVFAKTAVIYLSSAASMVLGTALFALLCRTRLPWGPEDVTKISILLDGAYGRLIDERHFFAYCIMYALQLGLLGGAFSVISAFISMFLSNKVMVAALPICIYQIMAEFTRNRYFSLYPFHAYSRLFEADWQCFLYALAISVIPALFAAIGILKKLKMRL